MAVKFGSARINENGKIVGGEAGDQTGKECSIQDWYLSSKGWIVIRAVNSNVADKIASAMQRICANDNIGYCQAHRNGLYNLSKPFGFDVSKVMTPTEVDCSEAVRVCLAYAGVYVNSFTTANESSVIEATGGFDILTSDCYCKKPDYLKRGDILVTRSKGHTGVVLTNGSKSTQMLYNQLQKGDKGASVKLMQRILKNMQYYHNTVDGDFGVHTVQSLLAMQGMANLPKDAICGNKTWSVLMSNL